MLCIHPYLLFQLKGDTRYASHKYFCHPNAFAYKQSTEQDTGCNLVNHFLFRIFVFHAYVFIHIFRSSKSKRLRVDHIFCHPKAAIKGKQSSVDHQK